MRIFKLSLVFLFSSVAGVATAISVRLPRSTPEAQGVSSSALLRFVEEADAKVDAMHSFMLVRHGQVVAEGWWSPYAEQEAHVLFSLSKSFTSTAVGLAVAEGKLSIDDPVLKFFPDEAPKLPSKNLQGMRVRDLLTMSTGHHDSDIGQFPFTSKDDLVKLFLSLPVAHKPGTHFVYNTPATYMQSAIVQKVTGKSVLEYLGPRLFEPLGIEHPTWEASAQGISMGGFGLKIRTEDIAHFGQLYLKKGDWHGKQLVPAAWVEAATARQTSNGSDPTSDWDQGYGYQFWRSRHGFYRGDGAFGQFCIVMPEYDAVIAITSGTRDMGRVMNLIWDLVLPAFHDGALPADPAGGKKLSDRLANVTIPVPAGAATSPTLSRIGGKRFVFESNASGIESLTIEAGGADGEVVMTTRIGSSEQRVTAASGSWKKGTLTFEQGAEPVAASGAWTSDEAYTLKLVRYTTPFATTYHLRYSGSLVLVDVEQNVAFGPVKSPRLVGELK